MQFFIFILLFCFLVFLFCLYLLGRDDFVLLRKDISLEQVFNIAFLVAVFSLISSRILFIILNPSSIYLNPLVFFLFPYFPGLSLTGAVTGGLFAFVLFFAKDAKAPKGRLLDFFSISFLAALPFGFLGFLLLSLGDSDVKKFHIVGLIIIYMILFIVVLKFALPLLLSGKLKDGSIGLIFLISFSTISLIENAIDRGGKKLFNGGIEDFILLLILFISAVFLFRQEKLLLRIKKYLSLKKT